VPVFTTIREQIETIFREDPAAKHMVSEVRTRIPGKMPWVV
jgi:hypothetical protein